MATISLSLLIDKQKNRVVFAESDKEFVDILFSFLTLPMGTVVRVLGKQSGVGCMDKLYQSVENLDMQFLEAQACQDMLLHPRSSSEFVCKHLKIRIEDIHPRIYYRCPNYCNYASSVIGQCVCGRAMYQLYEWGPSRSEVGDGVFVRGVARFIVADDLHVVKASTAATISLFQKLGIKNVGVVERKEVNFGREEILKLLQRALHSKSPLTDVFLQKEDSAEIYTTEFNLIDTSAVKSESETQSTGSEKICINLIESKATNKLVFAEAEDNFANLLFSFLTFPLGAIVRLLRNNSSMGSVDELYKGIEGLSVGDCIISEEYKNKLLDPKLPFHYRCSNSLFRIDEVKLGHTTETNPKLPKPGTGVGGSFVKRFTSFTVTDEMAVTHLSPVSNVEIFKELKAPIESLVERKVAIGETEALKLLKACLISPSALSNAFSPKK